jgi:hypothetical protein
LKFLFIVFTGFIGHEPGADGRRTPLPPSSTNRLEIKLGVDTPATASGMDKSAN